MSDADKLKQTASTLPASNVRDGLTALAELAPDTAGDLEVRLRKEIAARRHENAGAPLQAAEDRAYMNNSKELSTLIVDAVKEANHKATSDADKAKLAHVVAGLTGRTDEEAATLLADTRTKENLNRDNTTMVGRLFGSTTEDETKAKANYASIGDALKANVAKAVDAAAQSKDPYAAELTNTSTKPIKPLDAELASRLSDATNGMPPETRDAIRNIATLVPDQAKEIVQKAEAFSSDKRDHSGVASEAKASDLSKALLKAAEEYSQTHGGKDYSVIVQLAAVSGKSVPETATLVHTAAALDQRAQRLERHTNRDQDVDANMNELKAQEARTLQQASENKLTAALVSNITTSSKPIAKAAAIATTVVDDDIKPARAAAPAPEPIAAAKPEKAVVLEQPSTDSQGHRLHMHKVTVQNGGTMDAETLQKALKAAGKNLGEFGKNHDGIDNDAGDKTRQALLALRKDGKHAGDDKLVVYADELKQITELAAQYKAPEHHTSKGQKAAFKAGTATTAVGATVDAAHGHTAAKGKGNDALPISPELASIDPAFIKATMQAVVDPKSKGTLAEKSLKFLQSNGKATNNTIGGEEFNFALTGALGVYDATHRNPADKAKSVDQKISEMVGHEVHITTAAAKQAAPAVVTAKAEPSRQHEEDIAGAAKTLNADTAKQLLAGLTGNAAVMKGGKETRTAVAEFQKTHHIEAERPGTLDATTMSALVADAAAKYAKTHDGKTAPIAEEVQYVAGLVKPAPTPAQERGNKQDTRLASL